MTKEAKTNCYYSMDYVKNVKKFLDIQVITFDSSERAR